MTTITTLFNWKKQKRKFAALTAYDATFARLFVKQGINVILVGDSLGMTIQGYDSTIPVKISDIIYHTSCVRRGAPTCFLLADLPFMSYATLDQAYQNASAIMQSGANIVKLEGGGSWVANTISNLTTRSVPVCGHIGITPQSVNIFGGYKIQGRDVKSAERLLTDAITIEQAGAKLIVLECIPVNLADRITRELTIPVIGIGAGTVTDGQLLVMHDVLGITGNNTPSFSRNFLSESKDIESAISLYIQEVESGIFPSNKYTF